MRLTQTKNKATGSSSMRNFVQVRDKVAACSGAAENTTSSSNNDNDEEESIPATKKSKTSSNPVHYYFEKRPENKVKCTLCKDKDKGVLTVRQGSTSSLWRHLQRKHYDTFEKMEIKLPQGQTSTLHGKYYSLTHYMQLLKLNK